MQFYMLSRLEHHRRKKTLKLKKIGKAFIYFLI